MKTGVNTGTIINVKNSPIIKKVIKESMNREQRASICIECQFNEDGFCSKFMGWAGRVNYKCLGIKDPHERKLRRHNNYKRNKKAEKKAAELSASQIEKLAKRYRIK